MNMPQNYIIDSLNPKQREAVVADDQSLLVLAGAGSGKTRVLVHRIAWLLANSEISPFSVLAVTFTNKAANEMIERVGKLITHSTNGMWIGTFHGLAHRMLRRHCAEAGLPESFQIIDSEDQRRIIRAVIREMKLDEEKYPPKVAQWYVNKQKDNGLRPGNLDGNVSVNDKAMIKIYEAYEKVCNTSGLVDFAEILLRSHELWLNNSELLHHYQNRFEHILVDEFQDTNTIQYAWLQMLTGNNGNIMVVGDDDQSIYGWRGAKIENIHRFQKDYQNTATIRLEQNYRSTANILHTANELIGHNRNRLGKKLWTNEVAGESVSLYRAFNERIEARFIASQIYKLCKDGCKYKNFGVLYRSNAQSRVIEESLLQSNIPYRIYGGLRFYERAEIKNVLAYLHLITNCDNDAAFVRIINLPTRAIGAKTLEEVRKVASQQNISLWCAAKFIVREEFLAARAKNALKGFIQLVENLSSDLKKLPLSRQVEHVIDASGLMGFYKKDQSEAARSRLENLDELVNAAQQFKQDSESAMPVLAEFLAHSALEAGENQNLDDKGNCVQLMTLHSAKGLEFPVVFMTGLEEGLFPHQLSIANDQQLQEERRLCYVGITRAEKKLYLSYAQFRKLQGRETFRRESRFIKEIPKRYIVEISEGVQ